MENQKTTYEVDLLLLARSLWHRAWIILLATIIGAALALGYSLYIATPLYSAETLLYVDSRGAKDTGAISASDLLTGQKLVERYRVILTSRSTLNRIIESSGSIRTPDELKKMIKSKAVSDTEIFSVTVTSPDPKEATTLTSVIADVLPSQISKVIKGSSVELVDRALQPEKPSSPRISYNMLIGALIGILVSIIVLTIRFLTDTSIQDEEDLLRTYEIPILAAVPHLAKGRQKGTIESQLILKDDHSFQEKGI